MAFKTIDDIEREKHRENREKLKGEISEDISDVIENVFGRRKKEKLSPFGIFLKALLFIFLGLILVNLVLGNIWLLKFLIKSLFLGG